MLHVDVPWLVLLRRDATAAGGSAGGLGSACGLGSRLAGLDGLAEPGVAVGCVMRVDTGLDCRNGLWCSRRDDAVLGMCDQRGDTVTLLRLLLLGDMTGVGVCDSGAICECTRCCNCARSNFAWAYRELSARADMGPVQDTGSVVAGLSDKLCALRVDGWRQLASECALELCAGSRKLLGRKSDDRRNRPCCLGPCCRGCECTRQPEEAVPVPLVPVGS